MKIRDLLKVSYKALLINKGRSVLTMLGIIIGIASVILMVSVGQAAQDYLLSQVASFGSDLVFIGNGTQEEDSGPPSAAIKQVLTAKDMEKIRALSWVRGVAGSILTSDLVSYGSVEKIASISGSSPDETVIFNIQTGKGRFLLQDDIDSHARVVVLGSAMADRLFGQQDPIGGSVKIGKLNYRVIGVMRPAGTRFFTNIDEQVYIPYTALFDAYGKNRLNFISVKTGTTSPSEAKKQLTLLLRDTHNIDNPNDDLSKDDFNVATQEDTIKSVAAIGSVLQILLGSIASISLFVAGIGIMNIMYVTVTERTREIGLRKAIGAQPGDILRQFLFEAILLTVVAGAIGSLFGITLSWLAIVIISSFQAGWVFVLPWNGVAMGFGVSVAIGVIFGYFPARRAAKMSPIEALRYE